MAQNIIVCKYGGSSITCKSDIERIRRITSDDSRRRIIVVSAPGKRKGIEGDEKVTDMLINLAKNKKNSDLFDRIMRRYQMLAPGRNMRDVSGLLEERLGRALDEKEYRDAVASFGEEACARILADINGWEYADARELFVMSLPFGAGRILPKSKEMIRKRFSNLDRVVVTPGFFGYTEDGKLITLERNMSDLSGSYVAASVEAGMYENFSDSAILAASPDLVDNPRKIEELTYKESRDLSFTGFNILHHQAMLPVQEAQVPIHVRSTKDYPEQGTIIKSLRELDASRPIVGVAYKPGFYYTFIEKPGLDDMLGVLHRLTGIFEREGIQLLDIPGAIDEISFIYHSSYVKGEEQLRKIEERIYDVLGKRGTSLTTKNNLGMVAVAGEGISGKKGILEDVADSIIEAGVDILTVCHGVKKRCALYGVDDSQGKRAVQAVYERFLK